VQVNLVGKAQTSYLPGVLIPEVNAGGAAALAGLKSGDIILRVGDFEVPASNKQVCSNNSSTSTTSSSSSGRRQAAF
jgi:S1-C subfamily serine protease